MVAHDGHWEAAGIDQTQRSEPLAA